MAFWIKGDLHVHSNCDEDGFYSVEEIIELARPFCDFLAVTGHARGSDNWGLRQYQDILKARKKNPGFPVFHSGEWEFPIKRHVIVLTTPDTREFELQRDLVRKFDRLTGAEGVEKALEGLRYIESNWGDDAIMIFNHPNSPPVSVEDFRAIATSSVFRIIACYDRGHRRAEQTWDVGAEWDQLLMTGKRVWVRFGSDFHQHYTDGHTDYYPGEFAQDQLLVEEISYKSIFDAYRQGKYFCTIDNIISELHIALDRKLSISFACNEEVSHFEIISNGRIVDRIDNIREQFNRRIPVPEGSYYRLRGFGVEKKRKYDDGFYTPVFMSNPVFRD